MDTEKKTLIENYAVVIGDWHFNSLGMIRSLGEKDIPVVYINLSDAGYGETSKYTVKTYHAREDGSNITEVLFEVLNDFKGKPVIFTGCDKAALALDNAYSFLKDKCYFPNLKGNANFYMNKENMCKAAKESGFIIPETETFNFDNSFIENVTSFGFPCILKPVLSVEGNKADIQICENIEELQSVYRNFLKSEENYSRILVQRFLKGTHIQMLDYSGCKTKNSLVDVYGQLEKTREYPISRGSTSYAVIKKNIQHFNTDSLDKFLEAVGYEGLFDLDFMLVDSTPFFIEINFRNGAISYAFTKAGFNIPYIWYCKVLGLDYQKPKISETILMCERDDLNHVKDRNIGLLKWLKDVRKTDVFMLFNKNDPQPFINAYNKIVNFIFSIITKRSK